MPASQTPQPSRLIGQTPALWLIILLFVATNIGAMFLQLRNAPSGQVAMTVMGFPVGILLAAPLVDVAAGTPSSTWRTVLTLFTALPALFALAYFELMRFPDFQPGLVFLSLLWGMFLGTVMGVFFRHVPPEKQALYLGFAMGAGHLCWSLVMPIAGGLDPDSPNFHINKEAALSFLNLARCLACMAAAALVWFLIGRENAQGNTEREIIPCGCPGLFRPVFRLLLPLAVCGILNGVMGYLFLVRLFVRGGYMEYAHLVMALFFPLAGLAFIRWGKTFFPALLIGATLCYVVSPLAFLPSAPTSLAHAVFLACAFGQQTLFFAGTLALVRLQPQSRRPSLLVCLPWAVYPFCAIMGGFVATKLLPALGPSHLAAVCALAALCAASIPLMLRAFPLPELPVPAEEQPDATAPLPDPGRLATFGASYGLSKHELLVMEMLVQQRSTEDIATTMKIAEGTVRKYVSRILQKTGVPNRAMLIAFFAASSLISAETAERGEPDFR